MKNTELCLKVEEFVNLNAEHLCRKYKLEKVFFSKPSRSIEYYMRFGVLFSTKFKKSGYLDFYIKKDFLKLSVKEEFHEIEDSLVKVIVNSYLTSKNSYKYIKRHLKLKKFSYQDYKNDLIVLNEPSLEIDD